MYLIKNIWNLFSLNISLEAIWSSLLTNMVYNNRKKLYQKIENASKISKLYMVKIFLMPGQKFRCLTQLHRINTKSCGARSPPSIFLFFLIQEMQPCRTRTDHRLVASFAVLPSRSPFSATPLYLPPHTAPVLRRPPVRTPARARRDVMARALHRGYPLLRPLRRR